MIQFHTVTLNGVPLHYGQAPGPGPALVIVHGLTGSHTEFLHLVPELARQAHVYLLDWRGHGRSGHRQTGYQIADYGRDLIAFCRQVVGQPVILAGHSLGALVAIWLAANKPTLLQGLFLVEPPLYILQMPRFGQTAFYHYFTDLRDYLHLYHANGARLEEMVAYVGHMPVDDAHTLLDVAGPEAVRERAVQLHQLDAAVLEPALTGTLFGADEPDDLLAQIRCPVHLLAAQFSLGGALELSDVQRAVAQMPPGHHTIVAGAGHDIHLDQPAQFVQALTHFLATV